MNAQARPKGYKTIKLFSCSTQLSTKFQLLLKLKYQQIKKLLDLSLSDVEFIILINVNKYKNANNCWHFNIYEQDKFRAHLS